MHTPTHACTHMHSCMHTCTHTLTRTCTCIHTASMHACTHTHTHTHTPHLGYSHLLENLPSTCIADPRIGCPAGQIIQYMFISQLSYRSNKLFVSQLSYRSNKLFVSQFYRSKEMKQLVLILAINLWPLETTILYVFTRTKIDCSQRRMYHWCQIIGFGMFTCTCDKSSRNVSLSCTCGMQDNSYCSCLFRTA